MSRCDRFFILENNKIRYDQYHKEIMAFIEL